MSYSLRNLDALESEAIHTIREVAAAFENPVLLYSIGKDSMCMLHVARKAFAPGPVPFALLHIDTTWNFRAMIEFRDRYCAEHGFKLIVHVNEKALAAGMNPFDYPSSVYTPTMNTHALIDALDTYRFDAALGGGRRDEEKSRAKERVFSFRDANHQWNPKNQRPELWSLYNTRIRRGENIRVFPLSNWTELDVWQFIAERNIEVPSLYFAHRREVVRRAGMLMAVHPALPAVEGDEVEELVVRYRTVGDASCTGAIASVASTPEAVIAEIERSQLTERGATRADDRISDTGMEDRKREGYF